jgi:hypothetical protein
MEQDNKTSKDLFQKIEAIGSNEEALRKQEEREERFKNYVPEKNVYTEQDWERITQKYRSEKTKQREKQELLKKIGKCQYMFENKQEWEKKLKSEMNNPESKQCLQKLVREMERLQFQHEVGVQISEEEWNYLRQDFKRYP